MINSNAKAALNRLGEMPGMYSVKDQVEQMIQFSRIAKLRERHGLKTSRQSNHMIFTGNPGTGKTTAARLIGEAFAAMGLLKTNQSEPPFIEVHHADVTHPHVGQAEITIKKKFEAARGGVLFIDEAYAFVAGESKYMTGEKVIAAIVQLMEDLRDEVVVIVAGYPNEMDEFLDENPGLRSRFPTTIHFPDYSVVDLLQIAQLMLKDQEYQAAPDYLDALGSVLRIEKAKPDFGNARTLRNHVERSIRRQSVRVSQMPSPSKQDLITLHGLDLVHDYAGVREMEKAVLHKTIQEAQARLLKLELKELLRK